MEQFSDEFRAGLRDLLKWRRDVRHFKTDPVDEALLMQCLDSFSLAPSVGLSEPWRIIRVRSATARAAAFENFTATNAKALEGYSGEQAQRYAGLKLAGMREAPEQLAVFCDEETPKGSNLGASTMPEMRRYSVVSAITQMWLVARAVGLGVGWVSILDPDSLKHQLDVPDNWRLVAYLCLGYPADVSLTPELEEKGWETRANGLRIEER